MLLELYAALHMLTDINEPERFKNHTQISLYPYLNDVGPEIQFGIYKFTFDVEAEDVKRYDINDPSELNFGKFRKDHYFYRPNPCYGRPSPTLVSVERVTRSELETSLTIPKIEVVVTPDNPTLLDQPEWWTAIWVEEALRKYAPKWIGEAYATKRMGNHFVATYIPVTINRKQVEAMETVRSVISDLIDASECNYLGTKRHLF